MPLQDPTAWMDDLNVYLDDEEVASTAALWEPELLYRGSRVGAALWLAVVGLVAGVLGAVTFSPGIRGSLAAFGAYLLAVLVVLRAVGPLTRRLLDASMTFHAKSTVFWAVLLAAAAMLGAARDATWAAYAISVGGGVLLGIVHGGNTPRTVRREDAWMMAALPLAPLCTGVATWVHRNALGSMGSIAAAAVAGAIAGAYFVPMSALLAWSRNEAHGLAQLAKLYLHNENFAARAVACLDRAIALAPDDAELYNLRGTAYSKLDDAERAAADWARMTALLPQRAEPIMNLGVDHLRRGQLDRAVELLEHALQLDGNDATIHSNLGAALERRGDLDRAIAHYDHAIAIRPRYPNAFANRAFAHFRRGDHARAVADCERALTLQPHFANAAVNRAHALGAMGEHAAAARSYREALEMDPSPEVREEALRGLEALGAAADDDSAPS
ncbi:tetratricopeptide repeat protein [Roseisolibacter agri]|uniref:Tetratricopeptide repeat protein n=1 Tax=Roseisolibacter agri TaxID=2014610 RepID=A0AA37VBS6_9BACT|nr:tetratricopeptide repeat protein [Roseisolibacter agri]GLC26818.1 hypothetical protein rosag_33310 [Roseisolibacter agri]